MHPISCHICQNCVPFKSCHVLIPVKDKLLLILKSQTINRKIIEEKQLI